MLPVMHVHGTDIHSEIRVTMMMVAGMRVTDLHRRHRPDDVCKRHREHEKEMEDTRAHQAVVRMATGRLTLEQGKMFTPRHNGWPGY